MKFSFSFVLFFIGFALSAEARVFSFKNASFGTYIRGSAGPSLLKQSTIENPPIVFDKSADYNTGGEFGVIFRTSRTNVRIGGEIIRPLVIAGASGQDNTGTTLYTANSGILAYGPVLNLDMIMVDGENHKFFLTLGGGYMNVILKNDVAFSPAGSAIYHIPDFTEEASSWNGMAQAGLGWEVSMAKNVSFELDGGYRFLTGSTLIQQRTGVNFQGAFKPGDTMKNSLGADRVVNLSGVFIGLGFRFYIEM